MTRLLCSETLSFTIDTAPSKNGTKRIDLTSQPRLGTLWEVITTTVKFTLVAPSGTFKVLDMYIVFESMRIQLQHYNPAPVTFVTDPSRSTNYASAFNVRGGSVIGIEAEASDDTTPPFLMFNYDVQLYGTIKRYRGRRGGWEEE